MQKLLPFILFTLLFQDGFGQQWKWWAANFLDDSATQVHEIAASPKGGAAMVVSANKVKTAGIPEEWTDLQNTLLITDVNGIPEKIIPLRFKVLKMTFGFDGDNLFMVVLDSTNGQRSLKLCMSSHLFDEGFSIVDSVILDEKASASFFDIDMVMIGGWVNADIVLTIRPIINHVDIGSRETVYFMRAFMENGKFRSPKPNIVSILLFGKKILSATQIEVMKGEMVILSHRENEGYRLSRLFPTGAIRETIALNGEVEKASIASSNGRLYLQAFFDDSLTIGEQTVAKYKEGWAVASMKGEFNFEVDNVVSGIETFDWLSDRKGSFGGKTLFDGGNYYQPAIVTPFHYYTRTGRRLGFFKFETDLTSYDSTSFFILDFEPVPSNTIRAIMAPHLNGTYFSIPQLKTVKTLSDNILRFPKNNSINAFAESGFGSLLLHYSNVEISLKQKPNCFKTQFYIQAPFLGIEQVLWEVDGNRVQNHSFDTITLFHQNFKENARVLARVRFSNGTNLILSDSLYPKRVVYPKVDLGSTEVCQWNKLRLKNNSTSDTFNQPGTLGHIWEFWKNDTVFVSDTNPNPEVSFTMPGVYTLKYYANNGVCKQGLVLKDTVKVLPAAKARILGFPFPVCAGSEVQLKPQPYPNTQHVFNWYDGLESPRESSRIIKDVAYQWVVLTTTSANGCETKDSAYFRVRLPGNSLVDSVITGRDLTPTFYMTQGQGFRRFRVERNNGSLNQTLWEQTSYRDKSVDLSEFDDGYTFWGIDSCGNESRWEVWQPAVLEFVESENRIRAKHFSLGWHTFWAKRGSGEWQAIPSNIDEILLDTLTDVYQFKYRSTSRGLTKVLISNTIEVTPQNQFFLPNAFSPNGDGVNDIFSGTKPKNAEIMSINVFARTGQLVQHSNDVQNIWDGRIKGTEAPVGAYTYVISYKLGDQTESLNGTVTLVK